MERAGGALFRGEVRQQDLVGPSISALLGKIAGVLCICSGLLLMMIRFGPRPEAAWIAFLSPPGETCAMPCWYGIQPGETSAEAALMLLQEHPLGGRVVSSYFNRVNGDGIIVWVSDQEPADERRGQLNARLRAHDHTVINITLSSGLLAGDALLALGRPTSGSTRIIQTLRAPPYRVEQSYLYEGTRVLVTSRTRCPFVRIDLWKARAIVELGEPDATYSIEPVVQAAAYAGYPPPSLWREQGVCW